MPGDLRFSLPDTDRSCPPRTSGFGCRAYPARTRATDHRELGKHPPTSLMGRCSRSAGVGNDRCWPWVTAPNRCLGHVGGTAGEDDGARSLSAMVTSLTRGEAVPGDPSLVGKGGRPGAAVRVRVRTRCLAVRGRSGAGGVTCGSCPPVVTAGGRQGSGVFGAVWIQCGPGRPRSWAGCGPLRGRPPAAPRVLRDRGRHRSAVSGRPFLPGRALEGGPLVGLGGL
jgi:hypothetical protein